MATDAPAAADDADARYRYDRFTTKLLVQDMRFGSAALAPGDHLTIDAAADSDGGTVALRNRERPLLLVTGSMTCPMTASSTPSVIRLHSEFGDRVDFALLSVREAHPGEHVPQPTDPAGVLAQARALRAHHDVPFPVLVDELDGRLHRLLDSKPNTAFLFDTDGRLVFRSLWASDERQLRSALAAVGSGSAPPRPQSRTMLRPMAQALGHAGEVIDRAGPRARTDLWRSALPMAFMARVAGAFRFLPPDRRGAVAMVGMMGAVAVGVAAMLILAS
jgi:hypothetical protein